jgi:hypothetical protein
MKAADPERYRCQKREAYKRQKSQRCASSKKYAEKNKEAIAGRMRRWFKANSERISAQRKEYRERNREVIADYSKAYREANREKIRHYYESNRYRYINRNRLRQMAEIQATPSWANLDAIKGFYESAANISLTTGIKHQVDHYYPLKGKTVCGLHVQDNLRVIPALENQRKNNRHPDEV